MTANILTGGVDIDTKFMARVNAKIADVGFRVAGVDISNRYEARGSATAIANTNLKAGGVDLATLFRDIAVPLGTHSLTAVSHIWAATQSSCGFNSIVPFGTLTPPSIGGQAVYGFFDYIDTLDPASTGFWVQMTTPGLLQNFFTSIVINGHTYLTASATSFGNAADSVWFWDVLANVANGVVYPVTIT